MKIIGALFFILFCIPVVHSQGTLHFNGVILVSGASPQTVPAGKVWKIVNTYSPSSPKFTASSGSGTCSGSCNGSSTRWTSFTVQPGGCPSATDSQLKINGTAALYNSAAPLWLPEGTTLQGNTVSCNNASSGFFDGVGYSCFCPPSTVSYTISVIEFNVIP